jgi:hypothetical protein
MTRCRPIDARLRILKQFGNNAAARVARSVSTRVGSVPMIRDMQRPTMQRPNLVDLVGGLVLLTIAALLVCIALVAAAN